MKERLRRILWIAAAVILLLNGALFAAGRLSAAGELTLDTEVHFIDVGQGDAALLLSGGQAVLVDAGTVESAPSLVRYLEGIGVTELYAAIASHPHADHIGGMAQVLETFPVEHFYMGPETQSTSCYADMLEALEIQGIQPVVPSDGDVLSFGSGATVTFLGPADDVPADNLNNRSLIALFSTGAQRVLFMGDAESAAEQSLLSHHPDLSCDILKVGHHGAATSSSEEFLRTIHPSVAVISCGIDNDYGHPSDQTLQNLSLAGVDDVRITAEDSTVVLPLNPPSQSKENAA
ncbi:MAG: MBL fold metallo-hydrolase [Clostridiaceae bacterium]|nr:MBL fold metallo-hydrolase [Clostridiaceae bacterium]